jgi:hypothetical protein
MEVVQQQPQVIPARAPTARVMTLVAEIGAAKKRISFFSAQDKDWR